MTDLVTLAQAQAFLQDSTSENEVWVQSCVDAASQMVIDFLGCDPSTQDRTETISGANTPFLYPNASGKSAPITGITSITVIPALSEFYGGWTEYAAQTPSQQSVIDLTTIGFDDRVISRTNGARFPRGQRNITLVYTSGYALTPTSGLANMPAAITQAVLYTAKGIYTTLGKEMNATSENYSGVMSQAFANGGPGGLPPGAAMLLKPYQIKMFSP